MKDITDFLHGHTKKYVMAKNLRQLRATVLLKTEIASRGPFLLTLILAGAIV